MKLKFILAILAIAFSATAEAATLESKDSARKLTDEVMAKVVAGELEAGFLMLKPYLIIPESELNVLIEQTKLQLPVMQGRFGKVLGSEFINEKIIGKSLMRVTQIQKFEKHIVRWNFIFYNPNGKWVLNTFYFDDKIHAMFD